MPTLHVLLNKEALRPDLLGERVVIVLDILFATSTIVHAFGAGAASIWPALDRDDATRIATGLSGAVLAGEYMAEMLPGFAHPAPLALAREPLGGNPLVYCTTNGTVALRGASSAPHVYVGALLNGAALVAHVVRAHPVAPVLLICSGSAGNFNLEDFFGAGHFAWHFAKYGGYEPSDAARAALMLYQGSDAHTALHASRVGRMMAARNLGHEVDYAATRDSLDVVARLEGERLLRVS
jgi:2-phosphosulfolactate phosphatase